MACTGAPLEAAKPSFNGAFALFFRQLKKRKGHPVNMIKAVIIPVVSIVAFLLPHDFPPVQAQEDRVVATVNGRDVHNSEIEVRMEAFKGIDPAVLPDARDQVLNEILAEIVMDQFIEKEGIKAKDEEVEAVINSMRESIKNNPRYAGKTLEDVLSTFGKDVEQLRTEISNSIALRRHFSQNVDYDTLIEYFNENKDAFTGKQIKASHILIDAKSLKTKKEYAIANDKIHRLKKQLDEGADFAELAKANSSCPSAQNGGDLGFFPRKGMMVEPFAEAAFKLKVGEISEPVQTEFGFHIIKVTDVKEGKEVKFEDVKDRVEEIYVDNQIQNLIKKQLSEAKIEIKEPESK